MFDFIVEHQLNIILAMSGACAVCVFFVLISKSITGVRKRDLMLVELSATGLLIFDRGAAIFDGQPGELAFWMVRICNGAVFLLTLTVVFFFNLYLKDILTDNDRILVVPKMLRVTGVLCLVGMVLVVIALFTGMYYTFDDSNTYVRGKLFFISYIFPMLIPLLQLSFVFRYYNRLRRGIRSSLLLFPLVPMVAGLLQFAFYGLMLTDMALSVMSIQLYVIALMDINSSLEQNRKKEVLYLKKEEKTIYNLFSQIVTAFVNAIDAKDNNTKGHASRSAGYAKHLAELAGKSEEESEIAYFSALLHDVGKISLPDRLFREKSSLNEEELHEFEEHVLRGRDILSGITEFPYLQEAAHYHHEWYDGTGYPDGLAGENIPEMARIVALADAYDEMSSIREDRPPLPQQTIREEFVKGLGKRFDPEYTKRMLSMIDNDKDYQLREHHESEELEQEIVCEDYRSRCSRGIKVSSSVCRISFQYSETEHKEGEFTAPSIIVFDSLDGRVHTDERSIEINRYSEYGELWFDGHLICTRARNMKQEAVELPESEMAPEGECSIEAVKVRDHIRIRLNGCGQCSEVIVALPDSSGTAFLSITGEHCRITDIEVDETGVVMQEDEIPRIADEVTYINRMVGDVPNIQVDGYLSAATDGVEVTDGMEIVFHTMTLPAANRVWQCPFLVFFKSDDHRIHGPNYEELVIVRLDGESVESGGSARSITETHRGEDFENWDKWNEINKKGYECRVFIRRKNDRIILHTENAGISVKSTIFTENALEDVRVAITGDQCALTDIRFIA